ncbi:hypothetical protein [Sphingobacterium sp.]|uniref:hypothetical protein n=1 Tax=Sphingobacterium sp. TaxID=341027 RepID=UPI0031D6DEF8
MEFSAKISGKAPVLTIKDSAIFSDLQQNFDIFESRNELSFNPENSEVTVREALSYSMKQKNPIRNQVGKNGMYGNKEVKFEMTRNRWENIRQEA